MDKVDLDAAFASFDDTWSPRIVATVNDYDVKIVHVSGEFAEHVHDDTDEYFHVLAGRLVLRLPDRTVTLSQGEVFTVPRGMPHQPIADEGTRILILEPQGTFNTGDAATGSAGVRLE